MSLSWNKLVNIIFVPYFKLGVIGFQGPELNT